MAHPAQKQFFTTVRDKFPNNFIDCKVIDCGSLDVNGSLKDLFIDCDYLGIDIVEGSNVDKVCKTHEVKGKFDTVISGEMLEHDEFWQKSLKNMYNVCKDGGLIAISAAGEGRKEHGTSKSDGKTWGTSSDYYKNITEDMVREVYKEDMFTEMFFDYNPSAKDFYFYGVKKMV